VGRECPTRVPEEGKVVAKIVVGVDGSEVSSRALAWALDEGHLRESQVEVVYAFEYQPEWLRLGPPPTLEGLALEDMERRQAEPGSLSPRMIAREHSEALIRSVLAETIEREGVEVRRTVADDQAPGPFLVQRSRDADLLVVGTRGRGSVGSILLGSVSTYCVHHAACPVVVIK
jgi:nucleotide-binding universal stress UspA family protein